MSKTTACADCNGMGKTLVKKSGIVKMAVCKSCKGKGKIAATTKKTVRVVKVKAKSVAPKHKATTSKEGRSVRIFTRDLDSGKDTVSKTLTDDQRLAKDTIEERAAFFGCPGKVVEIRKGPVITLYEFKPAKTTRIRRLIALQEDLALALSAEAVMVRRIPGKEVVGIEISNESSERQNVGFRASLASVKAAKKSGMLLPLNLGTDPFGEPVIDDLATMPHLLIAGSTGSGKSVSLNCIISSLLTVCAPDELEFYMIDPKGVELTHYNGIPHMKEKMVTSPHYAKDMLERLVVEMRRRLHLLTLRGVRDIIEYNEIGAKTNDPKMPRIVCIIDELGDLMMQDRREFTRLIAEISQIARATGIHMVAATQRPSVDVLSGRIKVNFPGRMAFKVTSSTDSRVIIHRKGAEGLLGRGDMLYLSPTRSTTIRIHAPWVPLSDVKAIADKLREVEAKRIADEEKARIAERERIEAENRRMLGKSESVPSLNAPASADSALDIEFGYFKNKKS